MISRIRAWRTRTQVLIGIPASIAVLLLLFVAVRAIQFAAAGRRDLVAQLPPGAHAVARFEGLPGAWPTLRSSPLARLALGGPPKEDALHELATAFSGKDPLPGPLTEDRAMALCVNDVAVACYDLDHAEDDLLFLVELPFLYYVPLPFAGLFLEASDAGGGQVLSAGDLWITSRGRTLALATRKERLAQFLAGGTGATLYPLAPLGPGVVAQARLDLAAMPTGSRFRADIEEALSSAPLREALHAVNIRSVKTLRASLSTDGTSIALSTDAAVERASLEPRLVSLYSQPPVEAAFLERLPARACACDVFRFDAEREWKFIRGLSSAEGRANEGGELGESLLFVYRTLGPVMDEFEERGLARRLFPHLGDTAAVVAGREASSDILLGSVAMAGVVTLRDEKAAMAVMDEFTGADLPESERKDLRLQKYGSHILRVVESRNRWKEGVSFCYACASKTLVAGTSVPLVRAVLDRLDGKGEGLDRAASLSAARKTLAQPALGQEFLWVDLAEVGKSLSDSAERFAQQRADRLIDRTKLREEIEKAERPIFRARNRLKERLEFDDHVKEVFDQRLKEKVQGFTKEIRDTADLLSRFGTAAIEVQSGGDGFDLRACLVLSPGRE